MDKKDLFEHSPVRYFEKGTNAGLKAGEMGLITAKKGLGKTAILVQFGVDSLLNEKGVVHVSFDQQSSNVISWYSSILAEIAKKKNCNVTEISEEIMKHRTILNFNQETFTLPKVVNQLKALKDGGIAVDSIVVDGLDLGKIVIEDLKCFAEYVKSTGMTAWFSYTNEADNLKDTLPKEKLEFYTTIAHVAAEKKDLSITVLKNGEGKIPLDAKTSLMCK